MKTWFANSIEFLLSSVGHFFFLSFLLHYFRVALFTWHRIICTYKCMYITYVRVMGRAMPSVIWLSLDHLLKCGPFKACTVHQKLSCSLKSEEQCANKSCMEIRNCQKLIKMQKYFNQTEQNCPWKTHHIFDLSTLFIY